MDQRFVPLLLVVLLAFLVPIIISRFRRVPVVVGEIMAGILIGPAVLGWVHSEEATLETLAEIGFAFLMFLSGLEIDFSLLLAASKPGEYKTKSPILLASLSFVLAIGLAAGISFWLTGAGYVKDPWMMMLILSTTSLGIVVPVLKEKKISASRFGQTLLLSALLADFITMFLITVYIAVRSTGLSLNILLIGVLFVPVVFLYKFGQVHLKRPFVRRLIEDLSDATSQIKVRAAFALMIAFVVLAELLGAELILGAFLGGVLASLLSGPEDEKLHHKLDAIGFGFFVPLFFIVVGIRFDLEAFLVNPAAWLLLPILFVAAFAIKILSALVFRFSFTWRETFAGGLLLSARLSLIIAASAIGVRFGAISESTNAAIILIAALSATFAPLGFNLLTVSPDDKKKRAKLIFGAGELAIQVGKELTAHGDEVLFALLNEEDRARIQEQGFAATPPVQTVEALLASLDHVRIDAFLALDASDNANLEACRAARAHEVEHILAFVTEPIHVSDFRKIGVQTLTPSMHRSSLLALMARNAALFSLMTSTEDERDLREFTLSNPNLHGKRVMEMTFPSDTLVLAIRRDDELIIPHGTTKLALGDHLTVLGNLDSLALVSEWLEGF